MADPITLQLDSWAFGGEAIGRIDGRVTFVPYALPGETVSVQLQEDKKDFARAELLEVLEPSPDRTEPVCPQFGVCGGCQLQHVRYPAQLQLKRQVVVDQLRRIGGFSDAEDLVRPTLGMVRPWEYRNHARFSVGRRHGELGFTQRHTRRLLRIDHCYLMHPSINAALHRVQDQLVDFRGHQLALRAGANTGDLLVNPEIPNLPSGQEYLEEEILNRRFRVASAAFFQVNTLREHRPLPEGLERWEHLVPRVAWSYRSPSTPPTTTSHASPRVRGDGGGCKDHPSIPATIDHPYLSMADLLALQVFQGLDPRPDDVLLDLYCGVGTFGILLAPYVKQVVGVEESPAAVIDAAKNAADLPNTRWIAGKTEKLLPTLDERPTAVVLDPARVGCESAVLEALASLRPERIAYVSCDPATLSRDLAILRDHGFTVQSIQPVDMFPQTYHVECVAVLRR